MILSSKKAVLVAVTVVIALTISGISYAAVHSKKAPMAAPTKTSKRIQTASKQSVKAPQKPRVKTAVIENISSQPSLPADNSDQCVAIYNKAAKDLDTLNTQIKAQLEKMKEIMASEHLAQSFGGISPLKQAAYTRDYNAASDEANRLINQYNTDKQQYLGQLATLVNTNSPGCHTAFNALNGSTNTKQ